MKKIYAAAALIIVAMLGAAVHNGALDITGNLTVAGTRTALSRGTALPGTCTLGDIFFDTDATAGSNSFGCTATNTWTVQGGGGGSISYSDCFISTNCSVTGTHFRSTITTGTLYMMRVNIPGTVNLKNAITYSSSGATTSSANYAIWTDSTGVPGTKVTDSEARFTNLAAAGMRQVLWGSGGGAGTAVLSPGTYWMGWATEDAAALFYQINGVTHGGPSFFMGAVSAKPGVVSCANAPTGTNTTYALPATCGTATAIVGDLPIPLILASAY